MQHVYKFVYFDSYRQTNHYSFYSMELLCSTIFYIYGVSGYQQYTSTAMHIKMTKMDCTSDRWSNFYVGTYQKWKVHECVSKKLVRTWVGLYMSWIVQNTHIFLLFQKLVRTDLLVINYDPLLDNMKVINLFTFLSTAENFGIGTARARHG